MSDGVCSTTVIVMGRKRRVYSGVLNHCYQRAADQVVLFYSYSDYLSFFTMLCVQSVKNNVGIVMLCLMADHFHVSATAERGKNLSEFMQTLTCMYAKQNNEICHRSGDLFRRPFGSAPKRTEKKIRTNIIYVGNNPVERLLVKRAEEYRWNFLAYAVSDHPFSEPLVIRKASWHMQNAVKDVKAFHENGQYLSYRTLQRLFAPLDRKEREQLVDFVIGTYNVIDYEQAISYFGSYEKMIGAMHVSTGSEYDVKEVFTGWADDGYAELTRLVLRKTGFEDIHDVFLLSEQKRRGLWEYLRERTSATDKQVANFLRISV